MRRIIPFRLDFRFRPGCGGPTIAKVHAFIDARGKLSGKHHEIYLSDIRKADPAKWKTVVRQPLRYQESKG